LIHLALTVLAKPMHENTAIHGKPEKKIVSNNNNNNNSNNNYYYY